MESFELKSHVFVRFLCWWRQRDRNIFIRLNCSQLGLINTTLLLVTGSTFMVTFTFPLDNFRLFISYDELTNIFSVLSLAYRINGEWGLTLNDTIEVTQKVQESSDVFLYMRNGFLGGRPGNCIFTETFFMTFFMKYISIGNIFMNLFPWTPVTSFVKIKIRAE